MAADASDPDAAYASAATYRGVRGLFPTFGAAAAVLRIARDRHDSDSDNNGGAPEDPSAVVSPGVLDDFYRRLEEVERGLLDAAGGRRAPAACEPFVVAVEGLDGTGKSTLVRSLALALGYEPCSTPPPSLSDVRPAFDKRGGLVARAFYAASNYVLQHEMRIRCGEAGQNLGFVVDRFHGTTAAYSAGWRNTSGTTAAEVDALDVGAFAWPAAELDPPAMMLLLEVDDAVRRGRVASRNACSAFNPWDDRLNTVPGLAIRIMAGYRRIHACPVPDASVGRGPLEVVAVDANMSMEEVLASALEAVRSRAVRFFHPIAAYERDPLGMLVDSSRRLGLCDSDGRRARHAPWCVQIATAGEGSGAPSLRSVGVHTVGAAGVLFFCRGGPGGGRGEKMPPAGGNAHEAASIVCVLGSYPNECQFRAEGAVVPLTVEECDVLGREPPGSLVSQMCACALAEEEQEQEERAESGGGGTGRIVAGTRPGAEHGARAAALRADPLPRERVRNIVRPLLFVPVRCEVLWGGPSSASGPRRFAWSRNLNASSDADGGDRDRDGWSSARRLAPFSSGPVRCPLGGASPRRLLRPVTLALTGAHCSGKRTIGRRLARCLGFRFDPELGDVLRDRDRLVPDGHRVGDGSSGGSGGGDDGDRSGGRGTAALFTAAKRDWDDYLHTEERRRDSCSNGKNGRCRVVETWHPGNLAWALQRGGGAPLSSDGARRLERRAREAVADHARGDDGAVVLLVHLSVSATTSRRRRSQLVADAGETIGVSGEVVGDDGRTGAARLPMADEEAECDRLHGALHRNGLEILRSEWLAASDLGIVVPAALEVDNDEDGEEGANRAIQEIVHFVQRHHWRRLVSHTR